jgi:hypothetical protein
MGVIPTVPSVRSCGCATLLRDAIITQPAKFPLATRRRLDLLLAKYFPLDPAKAARPRTGQSRSRAGAPPRRRG